MSASERAELNARAAHEQVRRRVLFVSVAGLILLSTTPVFGHHLAKRADLLLAGYDHVGSLCLIALHELLAPVHLLFHLLLAGGLLYAVYERSRAWYRLRRTLSALVATAPDPGHPLLRAASECGLASHRIRIVEGLPNPAFTTGFWRPIVYVASSLPDVLDDEQLSAVLAHEAAHVARRDPARLSAIRFLACALFFLPALRRLDEDLMDEAEILADDAAVRKSASLTLASAILILADWRTCGRTARGLAWHGVVGFQPFAPRRALDLLERRILRLAGEPVKPETHVTRRSLAGGGAILAMVWLSGLAVAHPLPEEGTFYLRSHAHSPVHCVHRGHVALSHLFCFGFHSRRTGAPCPHTMRAASELS